MYVVVYYIVLTVRNESTMVNSKKIQILFFYIAMHDQIIRFDHQVVCPTYIDINMDIVYL